MVQEVFESGQVDTHLLGMCAIHIDKALAVLNDLMEVFRAEAQGLVLQDDLVDCRELLGHLAESFQPQAERAGVALSVRVAAQLPLLHGDLAKLERVFSNLVCNALKFTPAGGAINLQADVVEGLGVEAGTRWLQVAVEDNDCGIPADRIPFVANAGLESDRAPHSATFPNGQGTSIGMAIPDQPHP